MKKHKFTLLSPSKYLIWGFLFIALSCEVENNNTFSFLDERKTNIDFENTIPNSDIINILSFEYIYNGGGVGTADFDKNGTPDLFFIGSFVDNALYLNQGKFQFYDISEEAGIKAKGEWCTGVSIVDINDDSWPDIYVSVNSFNTNEIPNNLLFVHQGLNEEGIPTFTEAAQEYGIQGGKHSMHAAFLDYDLDGDLDLYVLNNVLDLVSPTDYRYKQIDGDAPNNDQLFRNDGPKGFTDVSKEAGIVIEGYGLGLAVTDINKDGYPDIYVANDYITNDLFFINQKNGTFKNEIASRLDKQSKFSMGVSASDFDNDGQNDLFVLDMLSNDNYRLKKLNGSSNYSTPIFNKKYKYEEQNVRNMLQINKGDGSFDEMAFQAGVFASDWSWTPLCEDFDLDGDIDIYVTNGFPRDVTDLDFINYKANRSMAFSRSEIINEIPSIKISNILFENKNGKKFENATQSWGLDLPSFSNGAVAVDLDMDGDLDIVSNNINQKAFVIKNNVQSRNSIKVKFDEELLDKEILGTKIYAYVAGQIQYKEVFPHQSYLSSAPTEFIFGLGDHTELDSLRVIYPDLNQKVYEKVNSDETLILDKISLSPLKIATKEYQLIKSDTIVLKVPDYKVFDANLQSTIPFDYSHFGPKLIDTEIGIIACVGLGQFPKIITNNEANDFDQFVELKGATNAVEFDANNDGVLDLLFTKASYQNSTESSDNLILLLRDKNKYVLDREMLGDLSGQFLFLEATDVDHDGDDDLFLGSTYKSGQYPDFYTHYVALNQSSESNNKFLLNEVKHDFAIMDATWEDINGDGFAELHLAGHWQAITSFANKGGKIQVDHPEHLFGDSKGLWNNLLFANINEDSIPDLIVGNLGFNTLLGEGPVKLLSSDFDKNGTKDPVLFYRYNQDSRFTPMPLRDELLSQIPGKKKDFPDYESYTNADYENLFSAQELKDAQYFEATEFSSSAFLSVAKGFQKVNLPDDFQKAPICVANKVKSKIALAGNFSHGNEFWGSSNSSEASMIEFRNGEFTRLYKELPKISGDVRSILIKDNHMYISTTDFLIFHFDLL